eukprot:CAMPEP_0182433710 /NCGR_PEP_ID=MMETSP1167-20130531/65032_1 /TAXON_ID=2988 /ORGANISM="Mallomonas Sp, Strain CCMP3275" /LENGTH=295 /DNA_ID=CAMNT_0024622735 /DNA_START=305 /DNA_END=1192 /DNA_ORIENTATION=-
MISNDLKTQLSADISKSIDNSFVGTSWSGGWAGGGGASVGVLRDDTSEKEFFCKIGNMGSFDMLCAEYNGIKDMYNTKTIRVPKPICFGNEGYNSYAVFERLNLGGSGSGEAMGKKLAEMHKHTSPDGMYGWRLNNTIGATFQPNQPMSSWAEFWDTQRLGHMLQLCKRDGAEFPEEIKLRKKVKEMLSGHDCVPSLVHGDLWSGNAAHTKEGDPVIFDPATYYGDREVDIAMTYLFGAFSKKFYDSYNNSWPLPEGHEQRKVIYNLYHILNHYVLFGGGYLGQAQSMIGRILAF